LVAKQILLKDSGQTSATNTTSTPTITTATGLNPSLKTSLAVATKSATNTGTASQTATSVDVTPKNYNLTLKSTGDAWIRFQTDSDPIKDMTLHEGKTIVLRAAKVIKLFSGNLGALQATLNGQEIKSLIQPGRAMSAVLPESEIPNVPLPLFPPAISSSATSNSTNTASSQSTATDSNSSN
jgi:hypothetical protein